MKNAKAVFEKAIEKIGRLDIIVDWQTQTLRAGDRKGSSSFSQGLDFDRIVPWEMLPDPKRINQMASERSGEVLVNFFHPEQSIDIYVLMDVSGSMLCGQSVFTKAEIGIILSGTIAFSSAKTYDRFSFRGYTNRTEIYFPLRFRKSTTWNLVEVLANHDFRGKPSGGLNQALDQLSEIKSKSLAVVLSDFCHEPEWKKTEELFLKIKERHDISVFALFDPKEDVAFSRLFAPSDAELQKIVGLSFFKRKKNIVKDRREAALKFFKGSEIPFLEFSTVAGLDSVCPRAAEFFLQRQGNLFARRRMT